MTAQTRYLRERRLTHQTIQEKHINRCSEVCDSAILDLAGVPVAAAENFVRLVAVNCSARMAGNIGDSSANVIRYFTCQLRA